MKIEAVSAAFPSRVVTVKDTLDLIRTHSRKSFTGDIEKALKIVNKILLFSGASERRWLDKNEKPIDFLEKVVNDVFEVSGLKKDDIDLMIYTGIGRGFLEPGQSYLLAKSLGMKHVQCFDILDACMSWTRALHLADSYFKNNQYKNILIVNGEFNSIKEASFFPQNYQLTNLEQIKWTFPNFTLGDAATATLLRNDPKNKWEWHFYSDTSLADLCTIPMAEYSHFMKGFEKAGRNGVGRFCSFGNDMHILGVPGCKIVFKKLSWPKDKIKMIFPHASSKQAWAHGADSCGVEDKLFYIYPEYGNLVSASVPAGISLAYQQGKIKRADPIVVWVGSAGMSFAVAGFTF